MIENETQYMISLSWRDRFERDANELEAGGPLPQGVDPAYRAVLVAAARSEAHELRRQIAEYEAARTRPPRRGRFIKTKEEADFAAYWEKRLLLDGLAAGQGLLFRLLSTRARRNLIDATSAAAEQLRQHRLDYEREGAKP